MTQKKVILITMPDHSVWEISAKKMAREYGEQWTDQRCENYLMNSAQYDAHVKEEMETLLSNDIGLVAHFRECYDAKQFRKDAKLVSRLSIPMTDEQIEEGIVMGAAAVAIKEE